MLRRKSLCRNVPVSERIVAWLMLRRLAAELCVQAPALYWHLKSKQELVEEMATSVLTEARRNAASATGDWPNWAMQLGHGVSGADRLTVARRKPVLPHPYSHDGEQRDSSDSALVSGSRS